MRKSEAVAQVELLWAIAIGPAGAGRTTQLQRAVHALRMSAPTGYVREKVQSAESMVEIWNSPRRWQQWGREQARSNAILAVGKLREAVDTDWPPDPE